MVVLPLMINRQQKYINGITREKVVLIQIVVKCPLNKGFLCRNK